MQKHIQSIYEKYLKRCFDFVFSFCALIILGPVMIVIAWLVKKKLGSPVLFTQIRPGRNGELFKMYKFRSMTDEKDADGKLLPDDVRMTPFGMKLRETSLDELPEVFNILKGDMSIIGPRPQLVRDMVFMTPEQRMRHTAKPGLSGLAQVNGRNAIKWEDKLEWDLKYIKKVSFVEDVKIILLTVQKAFIKQEGITEEDAATATDFGDYLLATGKVSASEYESRQREAREILGL